MKMRGAKRARQAMTLCLVWTTFGCGESAAPGRSAADAGGGGAGGGSVADFAGHGGSMGGRAFAGANATGGSDAGNGARPAGATSAGGSVGCTDIEVGDEPG